MMDRYELCVVVITYVRERFLFSIFVCMLSHWFLVIPSTTSSHVCVCGDIDRKITLQTYLPPKPAGSLLGGRIKFFFFVLLTTWAYYYFFN